MILRRVKSLLLCLLLLFCVPSCERGHSSKFVLHPQKTGIATVRFYDESRSRPLITEVWYPIEESTPAEAIEGLWVRCPEARDAPLKTGAAKYPLIVMSHGNGSDRTTNAWLAEILAANGYIVASMDHYGNTWNNKIAECFIKIWERPIDVSFVVDKLLQDEKFGPRINNQKIGFIGYSLGGLTGVWIAGGQINNFDKPVIQTIPADQIPETVNEDVLNSIDFSPSRESYRDARISAVFLMAPALGYLFDLNSLQSISVPVYIVASEGDLITPLESSAHILANTIKKAAFTLIPGSASHYVYLNEVSKGGKLLLDKRLAHDAPDVNRARIHEDIGHSAVKFFNNYLKP
jgi:predicted dienelactone hydrolase